MVIETLWPDNAPWWLNLFIWMATFWWYILVGFVPAFYIAVAKLFGMPLLQRWSNEVIIILYPSKVKFRKITQQFDPYFRDGKGVYWLGDPLQPQPYDEMPERYEIKLVESKQKYEELAAKPNRTKKEELLMKRLLRQQKHIRKQMLSVNPINPIHIYTHAINQPIYSLDRRATKVDEILNNNPNPKRAPNHGIWLLQNPKLHFHRHYQLIVDKTGTKYVLVPVKQRQQFSIGFWHSLGIVMQKEIEVTKDVSDDGNVSGEKGKQLVQTMITTSVILQQMKEVQDEQNMSASRAFMILKRRAKIESGFLYWITGSINPMIFLVLGGMVAAIAVIFLMFHGNSPSAPGGPPSTGGGIKIL